MNGQQNAAPTNRPGAAPPLPLAPWRFTGIAILRIIFGLVWAVDAWFKWQPDFINNFSDYLTGDQKDQPAIIHSWIGFWVNIVQVDPHTASLT